MLAFLLLLEGAALAEDQRVEVVLVGGAPDKGQLVETMRELLGRVGLTADVRLVAQPDEARAAPYKNTVARVEIDLRSEKSTTIVAFGHDGLPHHRVLKRDPSPAIAREELAHALQTVVEAQLVPAAEAAKKEAAHAAPAPVIVEPAPAPAPIAIGTPADRDAVPPKPRRPLALDVNMLAGGGGFGDNAGPVMRVGGGVDVVWRKSIEPSFGLGVHYVAPFDASLPRVTANTSDVMFRAMAGATFYRNGWLALKGGVGGGADVLVVNARSSVLDPGAVKKVPTFVDPVITGMVGADVRVASSVSVTLRVVMDVDPMTNRYWLQHADGTRDLVFSPWNVRPAVMLGFNFTPFGPDGRQP